MIFLYNTPFFGKMLQSLTKSGNRKLEKIKVGKKDFFKVLITTISISLLNWDSKGSEEEGSIYKSVFIGYFLLLISILFDGLIALKESVLNYEAESNPNYREYKHRLHYDYMFLFNSYSAFLATIGITWSLFFTNFSNEWRLFIFNKEFMTTLVFGCIVSSTGQVFLYKILHEYGPLTLSVITGIRKIISIGASFFIFGKTIDQLKIYSIIIGVAVIIWELLEKSRTAEKEKQV